MQGGNVVEERAGHPTFWRTFGHGARDALAIHASLARSDAWAPVAERLADRLRMTAFDLPGHGQSADPAEGADLLTLSARIAASFIERQVDLIGHSFGAVVALRLAIAAPEAIRTLTLIEPVLFAAAEGTPELEAHLQEREPFVRALESGANEEAARLFIETWGTGQEWESLPAERRARMARRIGLIRAADAALYRDSGGILQPDALESLEMPVLLIRGTESPPVMERIAEAIAARLPDVGVATVPGAGHMAPLTHPDQVAGLIGVNLDRA